MSGPNPNDIQSSLTKQNDLTDLLQLQEKLYSPTNDLDTNSLQQLIENLHKKYSSKEIDHQLILAFSLDYTKIPLLVPLLSKKSMEKTDFIHCDQELLFHLFEANISFPLILL